MAKLKTWVYVVIISFIVSILITVIFKYPLLTSLRVVFGLIYVLFLPGYVVVKCFFEKVDWIEKLGLSLGLSVVLVVLSVMFSNMLLRIPITPISNFFVILGVIIITLLVKKYQRQKHPGLKTKKK